MSVYIEAKHISVSFNHHILLENISFVLHAGEILTLLGPNGAGKSTLAKVLLGLVPPTSGQLIKVPHLRIGYVPQKINLDPTLPLTVERFILLKTGAKRHSAEFDDILIKTNIFTLLKKSIQTLSGGEMQRVLLAQALFNHPQLLVLDEPTQGVDINSQATLYDLIEQARNELKCAVFMISHDLTLVMARTDHVLCINKHICCFGTPSNIIHDPEFIALFGKFGAEQLAIYHHQHHHLHK